MQSYNSFRVAQQQILEAAKILNLDDATTKFLTVPQLETSFTIPLKMDNEETKIFQAYRIQYNTSRGPAKGWHSLSPGRNSRYNPCTCILDDMEDCSC